MKASRLLKASLSGSLFALSSLFLSCPAFAAPGAIVWEADYMSNPGRDSVQARGLAIGPKGEIAVAGLNEHADGNYNYLLIKYGPYGTTEWIREYDYAWFDAGKAVAFDKGGDIIVAGAAGNPENPRDSYSGAYYNDYRATKYSAAGGLLAEFAASGYGKNNDPGGVAADGEGNVYVTGAAMNAPNTRSLFYTVKFGPDGGILWEKVEEWGAEAYGTAITLGGDGNPVVAGYFRDPANDTYSIRVLRYDSSSGRTILDVVYNNAADNEKAWGVASDYEGNIYISGETDADYGTALTVKFGPEGELLWAKGYKDDGYPNRGKSVAVDGSGRAYVVGKVMKEDQRGDWLLLVYDERGRLLLDRTYAFGGDSSAESAAIDIYGNLVVTGNIVLPGQRIMIKTLRIEGFRDASGSLSNDAPFGFGMPYGEWMFTDLLTPTLALLGGKWGCPDKVKLCPIYN